LPTAPENGKQFGATGDEPVEILSLLGKQGERIHVRDAPRRKAESA
jgi:hypothetical protein